MLEEFRLDNIPFCGGTADVSKIFDQVLIPLVYDLAQRAGMPNGVLEAYIRFQEELRVRNTIGGAIGKAYSAQLGIPQCGSPVYAMRCPNNEAMGSDDV